jgi:hypothetical protein
MESVSVCADTDRESHEDAGKARAPEWPGFRQIALTREGCDPEAKHVRFTADRDVCPLRLPQASRRGD